VLMEKMGTSVTNGAEGPGSPVAASRATFVFIMVTVALDFSGVWDYCAGIAEPDYPV